MRDFITESTHLDAGDPTDLVTRMEDLQKRYGLTVIGDCCGSVIAASIRSIMKFKLESAAAD
jgi:hypothetical protein